ncbi:MAG: methylisocitrate lyase, partial [Thiothrix sp.]
MTAKQTLSPGQKLRQAVEATPPLQVVGAVTANSAI